MVHALEAIRSLLKPGGYLIDIHPVPHWLFLRAVQRGKVLTSESKPMTYSQDVLQAEDALEKVVERGFFVVEEKDEFDFLTYASSVDELRTHWQQINEHDDTPEDTSILLQEEEQLSRFHTFLQAAGEGVEVLIHEKARIARMRPMR